LTAAIPTNSRELAVGVVELVTRVAAAVVALFPLCRAVTVNATNYLPARISSDPSSVDGRRA
jgi:hypothetical protein